MKRCKLGISFESYCKLVADRQIKEAKNLQLKQDKYYRELSDVIDDAGGIINPNRVAPQTKDD